MNEVNGFISFYLLRPTQPDSPYVAMTFWDSTESHQQYQGSEQLRQSHAGLGELQRAFLSPPTMEMHEVAVEANTA